MFNQCSGEDTQEVSDKYDTWFNIANLLCSIIRLSMGIGVTTFLYRQRAKRTFPRFIIY